MIASTTAILLWYKTKFTISLTAQLIAYQMMSNFSDFNQ